MTPDLLTLFSSTFRRGRYMWAFTALLALLPPPHLVQAQSQFNGALKSISITDSSGVNKPPLADFTYNGNSGLFTFDASSSSDPDGSVTKYFWDIDNGALTATGLTATANLVPGTHAVTLTVSDNAGAVTIKQALISYSTGPERAYATSVNFKGYTTSPTNTTSEMLSYLSDKSDSTYAATSSSSSSNTLQNSKTAGAGPWSNLRVVVRVSSQTAGDQIRCTLYSGGTLYNGQWVSLTTSPTDISTGCNYALDPKTGGQWTKAIVESLYFGTRTNTSISGQVRVYETYLELTP